MKRLDIEVRQTSRRFDQESGKQIKASKLYMALAGNDGDPHAFGRTVSRTFDHGDKLSIVKTSELEDLIRDRDSLATALCDLNAACVAEEKERAIDKKADAEERGR